MKIADLSTVSPVTNYQFSTSLSRKYHGLIEESGYKKVRNSLFEFCDYIAQISPPMFALHSFISVWRIAQYMGPALLARYVPIWGKGSPINVFLDVLTTLLYFSPASVHDKVGPYFLYCYSGFWIIIFGLLGGASAVLVKTSKLSHNVAIFFTFIFGTFGYLLHVPALVYLFEIIGLMISEPEKYATVLYILSVILSAICLMIYIWFFVTVFSVTIIFKPCSMQTVLPSVQNLMLIASFIVNSIVALGGELPQKYQPYFIIVTSICFFAFISFLFQKGGLVNRVELKAEAATTFACGFLLIIATIFSFLGMMGNELIFIVIVVVWLLSFFGMHWFFNRSTSHYLALLDKLEEDSTTFDEVVKSPLRFSGITVAGFQYAHSICISYDIFKFGVEKWPKDKDLWLLFAKFTAIYPEKNQQLSWVQMGMVKNHLKGSLAKHIMSQINTVLRQRENNLIPQLKSSIENVAKKVTAAKHKIRYIWDLVIQSNTKDIENVIQHAYDSVEECEAEFQHLLRQYPNSRFVARAYARFLKEVKADHAGSKDWAKNVTELQRGISIVPDQAHELGLRAFPALPKLLSSVPSNLVNTITVTDTFITDIEVEDEDGALDTDMRASIRESINNLKIPSYTFARISRVAFFLICFVAPIIALAIYFPKSVDTISQPLDLLYSLSSIRTRLYQALSTAYHYTLENTNPPIYAEPPVLDNVVPTSFGGTINSKNQTIFLVQDLTHLLGDMNQLRDFKAGDPCIDQARTNFYDAIFTYKYVYDYGNWVTDPSAPPVVEPRALSVQSILTQYVSDLHHLMTMEKPANGNDYITTKEFASSWINLPTVIDGIVASLEEVRDYVAANYQKTHKIYVVIIIVVCLAVPLAFSICCAVTLQLIRRDKMTIYRSLASLPKAVVSRVVDSFKLIKKHADDEESSTSVARDEEMNRQEENAIKIFSTSADNQKMENSDVLVIVISTLLLICLHIGCTCLLLLEMDYTGAQLATAAPHIDYVLASYGYDLASVVALELIPLYCHSPELPIYNTTSDSLIHDSRVWQASGQYYFSTSRYGNPQAGAKPFKAIQEIANSATLLEVCYENVVPDKVYNADGTFNQLKSAHNVYRCWSADLLTSYVQMIVQSFLDLYETDKVKYQIVGTEEELTSLWHIHQIHLYERYYSPMFDNILSTVHSMLNSNVPTAVGASFGFLAAALIIEVIILHQLTVSEKHMKFALRLLLHCPVSSVVGNAMISSILSGNMTRKDLDTTNRDAEFYDRIVKELPDAVFTCSPEKIILTQNGAAGRIFDVAPNEFVGKPIGEIGGLFEGDNPFEELEENQKATEKEMVERCVQLKTQKHLVLNVIPTNDYIIVTARDITRAVMYTQLINDERSKSDHLLSSILPARLVPRVQAGEKNISFAVQSATIVFMDIVSFTPWCGSLPAATVMKTLNLMFKEYDSLVARHPTMTKIKCIGDCYMAAGGIFMDVNQPPVHAKDVVEFGLDALEALEKLDEEINEHLQIRVGVNTGGPIVAGVLGTEKPTFEILGPAINMAQQMEHHGVAMKVHISRPVYELIYGSEFNVTERGETQIKNGKVVTYLINSRNQQTTN